MKKLLLPLLALTLLASSCDPFSVTSSQSYGVVKTSNGGVDWQIGGRFAGENGANFNLSISQIKFGPNSKIFASSYDGGLYKSEDAGETWQEVLGNISLYDFVIDPNNDQVIYASGYLEKRGRIFKTLDGGKSWQDIFVDAGDGDPVRTLVLDPFDSLTIAAGLGKGGVVVSRDGGQSWSLVKNLNDRINQMVWNDSGLYVLAKTQGLYRSTQIDGEFEQITKNLKSSVGRLGVSIFGSNVSDYRRMVIGINTQEIMVTTNNGLYRSFDSGNNWNYVSMPYRQSDAAPYALAVPAGQNSPIYVSSGSVIFKSTDDGQAWSISETGTTGLVTSILPDQNLSTLIFAGVSK
ncbi:MAG: hypothetical protein R3B41_00260 [Candidatus Doudnabacteria bacterium]